MGRPQPPTPEFKHGLQRLVNDVTGYTRDVSAGLNGVCCGSTDLISFGNQSVQYAHEPVTELVADGSFERVICLLLNGVLPVDEQMGDVEAILADAAVIDPGIVEILCNLPLGARPLNLLPLSISLLSFFDPTPHDNTLPATRSRILRLLAQLPVVVAAALDGGELQPTQDIPELSWPGRLLHQLRGHSAVPSPIEDEAVNILMICQCLTAMRPACFAGRVAAATIDHIPTSVQNASSLFVAQLRNDPFHWTSNALKGLTGPRSAEAWWIRREGAPMPFGFSSRTSDPRPQILSDVCTSLLGSYDRIVLESSARRLERILEELELFPTMDWMAARILTLLDVPPDRQSLLIAFARLVGWSAQAIEQSSNGQSLLPDLKYAGMDSETDNRKFGE
jgi:2-methylcitrate synthase